MTFTRAAVVVDAQNDFTEGGALAVAGGDRVCRAIGAHLARERYDVVVASMDWHVEPGEHFATNPDFVDTWPSHCVAHSFGAGFDSEIAAGARDAGNPVTGPSELFDHVVFKGQFAAAYSAADGLDDAGSTLFSLLGDVDVVDVMGIATSHCVRATVLSLLREGFTVNVVCNLCVGVTDELASGAFGEMHTHGARLGMSAVGTTWPTVA